MTAPASTPPRDPHADDPDHTIVALASGQAQAPRALIRVSGPRAHALLGTPRDHTPRAGVTRLTLADGRTLPALYLIAHAPRSYTGQDTLELLIPGHPTLVRRALDGMLARSTAHAVIREANPGEFSARAYLHGKLTLDQAEGVAATIAAGSQAELAAARAALAGSAGKAFVAIADRLATLLALVEAGVDFADQDDVIPIAPRDLYEHLGSLLDQLDDHLGAVRGEERPDFRPLVVLAGPPNAGKSTLFNALLRRPRALASPTPGTTRDVLREPLALAGPASFEITLADLPGLDATSTGPIDAPAQTAARAVLLDADLVLWCDPTARFDPAAPHAPPTTVTSLRLRTRGDQPSPNPTPPDTLVVCALDGHNLATLRARLLEILWPSPTRARNALLPRHRRAALQTRAAIREARAQIDPQRRALARPELVAQALRQALDDLGSITGRLTPDEIVGRIFATFCIGK